MPEKPTNKPCEICGKIVPMVGSQALCNTCQYKRKISKVKHKTNKYNSFVSLAESRATDLSKIGVTIIFHQGRWTWRCRNGLNSQRSFATMRECRNDAINALE